MQDTGQEGDVHLDRLLRQEPALDAKAGGPQAFGAASGHLRVRIAMREDHALHPGLQDAPRRRAACDRDGLQGSSVT